MSSLSYFSIKTASTAKDAEDQRTEKRDKGMLLFTFHLLLEKGYVDTAAAFASECSLNLDQYTICENIDLRSIFVEFEAYYNMRFQRYPQYFKKSNGNSGLGPESLGSKFKGQWRKGGNHKGIPGNASGGLSTKSNSNNIKPPARSLEADEVDSPALGLECHSTSIGFTNPNSSSYFCSTNTNAKTTSTTPTTFNLQFQHEKLIKPISGLDFGSEDMRMFAETIQKEIVVSNLNTKWGDVIGLESAKTILMESLVYSKEFVEFFGQAMPPWRGLLLYGPPGTGKTLLAKAVAAECGTTFFNISSASIVSKWRGDSEKIVKVLFDLARYHAPSTIFFDEFDALGSKRDSLGESDASRRLKSEILQQMDGLLASATASSHHNQHQNQLPVFILAATNLPWELDPAIIRRMEKRIYVPLPNDEERRGILKSHFGKTAQSVVESSRGRNALVCQMDFDMLALRTDGYSGSDLHQIVKETVMQKFRQSFGQKIRKLVILTEDVMRAVQSTSPTVNAQLSDKFSLWDSSFRAN